MKWGKAEESVAILRERGLSTEQILDKICVSLDIARRSNNEYIQRNSSLEADVLELKKSVGRIVKVKVHMIQTYDHMRVVWHNSKPYRYSHNGVWKSIDRGSLLRRYPKKTVKGLFSVWVELDEQDLDVVCEGTVDGFLRGMTCITLDKDTQRKMYLNTGDQVKVTKVRKG